jgi:hypothetical protein
VSEWTDVKDGLPEEEGVYLCHFNDGTIETFPFEPEDDQREWGGSGQYDIITHWMELPNPPHKAF